jgi:hypothetical protein
MFMNEWYILSCPLLKSNHLLLLYCTRITIHVLLRLLQIIQFILLWDTALAIVRVFVLLVVVVVVVVGYCCCCYTLSYTLSAAAAAAALDLI